MDKFKRSLGRGFPEAVQRNWRLLAGVAIVFFGVSAIAFSAHHIGDNPVDRAIEKQTEPSRKFLEEEAGVKRSYLEWTGFYLRNNLTNAVETIGLGVGFGIFSLYSLTMNSLTIGLVISETDLSVQSILSLLLPHGIFELTGFIIAIGCGVRLGIGSINSLRKLSINPLRRSGKSIADLIPVAILLIIIAAPIEGLLGVFQDSILNSTAVRISLIGGSLYSLTIILFWMGGKLTRTGDR